MEAKEKAKEIYDKVEGYIYTSEAHFADYHSTKNISIYCINQIIEACEYNNADTWNTDWWNKVKKEIEMYDDQY